MTFLKTAAFVFLLFNAVSVKAQLVLETPQTETILYLGKGKNQPLLVGLGGAEGGNAWSSDYWKTTRDAFISRGYAFVAIGYFGAKGTPALLNNINIDAVHDAISKAASHEQVNKKAIAIIGGSRGADLALLIASYYPDIKAVVGIVPSHVVFPGNTPELNNAAFSFAKKALPFVPVTESAIPFLIKRDLRAAFETMLKDSLAAEKARIPVERIQGAVLLLSATEDEICPSTPMSEKMMDKWKESRFAYPYSHIAMPGGHSAPLKRFDLIFKFLQENFAVRAY